MIGNNSSTGYYTNTAWDSNQKWAIIAACNQLTEPYHLGWARTLLGANCRAHAVWGYAQAAPIGPTDTLIVESFKEYCRHNKIMTAWYIANVDHAKNLWAGVSHNDNLNDYMPSFGTVTANTSRYSYPNIKYIKGGVVTSISFSSISSTSTPQYAHIYTVDDTQKDKGSITQAEITDLLEKTGSKVLLLNRRIQAFKNDLDANQFIAISPEEALRIAKDYAFQNKLLTESTFQDVESKVHATTIESIDICEDIENLDRVNDLKNAFHANDANPFAYTVVFRRTANGIPFDAGFGNSVKLVIDHTGVCWSSYSWENIVEKEKVRLAVPKRLKKH